MKNEPALVVSGSVGVEDHPLAAAQRDHRLANEGERRALSFTNAQRAGELCVTDRRARAALGERERHARG